MRGDLQADLDDRRAAFGGFTTMLQARVDGGEAYIVGVYKARACGCRVVGNGTLPHPLTVEPCEAHR